MKRIYALIFIALFLTTASYAQRKPMPLKFSEKATSEQKMLILNIIQNMVPVEGGSFTMGLTNGVETKGVDFEDEKPAHKVTVNDFKIARFEVTQREWMLITGEENPSRNVCDTLNLPVERVSWSDCKRFLAKLKELSGIEFRLPTEAEWEYAARGGKYSHNYAYSGSDNIDDVAWYAGDSDNHTHSVGTKQPNELGLYDMSGNVWEWVEDVDGPYTAEDQVNPRGPKEGSDHINRGGCYFDQTRPCRVSHRAYDDKDYRIHSIGFRIAY